MGIAVSPDNPDTIYVANTTTWKSTDAGKTFVGFKGAPGGDDYQRIGINPSQRPDYRPYRGSGRGRSVNGGKTWSSWYNQPTAQFYHVTTDNRFPYWVYGAQQESGAAATQSRSDMGEISFIRQSGACRASRIWLNRRGPARPEHSLWWRIRAVTRTDQALNEYANIAPEPIRSRPIPI